MIAIIKLANFENELWFESIQKLDFKIEVFESSSSFKEFLKTDIPDVIINRLDSLYHDDLKSTENLLSEDSLEDIPKLLILKGQEPGRYNKLYFEILDIKQEAFLSCFTGRLQSLINLSNKMRAIKTENKELKQFAKAKNKGLIYSAFLEYELILNDLGNNIRKFFNDIAEQFGIKDELEKKPKELNERMKELTALYSITKIISNNNLPLSGIFRSVIDLIPPGYRFPELVSVRIILNDVCYQTANFSETEWKQEEPIIVNGVKRGSIQVFYLKNREFLKEESSLLFSIAERIRVILEKKEIENELFESETKFRTLVENIPAALYRCDIHKPHTILYMSNGIESITGIASNVFQNNPLEKYSSLIVKEDQENLRKVVLERIENKKPFHIEYRLKSKDGEIKWVTEKGKIVYDENGLPLFMDGVILDITNRKQAEQKLKQSEENLNRAQQVAHIGSWYVQIESNQITWSEETYKMFGVDRSKQINFEIFLSYIHPDDAGFVNQEWSKAINYEYADKTRDPVSNEYDIQHRIIINGQTKWVREKAVILFNENKKPLDALGTVQDITVLKEAEEILKKSIKEKETLLSELFHRTKNNMQVVIAILTLQADYTNDEKIINFIQKTENRIKAMALVHQRLYQSGNLSRINLKDYINDLLILIVKTYSQQSFKVRLTPAIESVFVLIDTAIPCGLAVNEILSNSYLHAFPGDRQGEISIVLKQNNEKDIIITISDNGIGVPDDFDIRNGKTFGMETIINIVEHQLKGRVIFDNKNGITWTIIFKDNLYHERV